MLVLPSHAESLKPTRLGSGGLGAPKATPSGFKKAGERRLGGAAESGPVRRLGDRNGASKPLTLNKTSGARLSSAAERANAQLSAHRQKRTDEEAKRLEERKAKSEAFKKKRSSKKKR